jgi:hypothetical protein
VLRLKSCGHCLGDLFEEEILGERELVCIQCGNRISQTGLALAPARVYAQAHPRDALYGRPDRR